MHDDWLCASYLYDDGLSCDCGCGAVDPDCADSAVALVVGCPVGGACAGDGYCADVAGKPWCASNEGCAASPGQICKGLYTQSATPLMRSACDLATPGGFGYGAGCTNSLECATGQCVGDVCRKPCSDDSHCDAGTPGSAKQACVARPVFDALSGKLDGYAGVCVVVGTASAACADQATCAAENQRCTAELDVASLQPGAQPKARFLCEAPGAGVAEGGDCSDAACGPGLLCVKAASSSAVSCQRVCPAGDADCPAGTTCGEAVLATFGNSNPADDVKVPACVQP